MLNLLPSQKIKELRLNLLTQVIIRAAIAVIFIFLILVLLLLVIRFFLNINLDEAEKDLKNLQSRPEIKQLGDLENKITELNKNLVFLNGAYQKQTGFSSLLEKITQATPAGIRLNSISCEESGKVDIRGYAQTRDALLNFKETIEKTPYVSELSFPTSNLTQPTDITFYFNFKLVKHEL